jgi:hypothetical protein
MPPVIAVFMDGLKPESLEYMEFLNTLYKARLKTELGAYSPVCDTSIYTGVFLKKHLCWFTWKYSPNTSPFRILNKLKLANFPHNIYSKYACYKLALRLSGATNPAIFGFTVFAGIPMKYWACFDTDIKEPWERPNYYNGYPNLFKILETNNVRYEVVGTNSKNLPDSSRVVRKHNPREKVPLLNYFIGDIDHLSHEYGQDACETIRRLREIDEILQEKYARFEKIFFGDFYFIVFSDHGHSRVENIVNLEEIFKRNGKNLKDYIHFIDSNYARFWFRSSEEEEEVRKVLSELGDKGFFLTDEHFKKYKANMPDNRYGDLIFYLDKPNVFFGKEISALGRRVSAPVSMHGYLPDYPDSDGVLVSNMKLKKNVAILQDIAPSILQALGLKVPDYMDGEPVWKRSS